jgi:leucyl aminopeptidase
VPVPSLTLSSAPVTEIDGADTVAVPVAPDERGGQPGPGAAETAEAFGIDLAGLLAAEKAKGEPGEVVSVPVTGRADGGDTAVRRLLAVGVGDGSPGALRRAGAAAARRAKGCSLLATPIVESAGADELRAFCEGILLGSYTFDRKSEPKTPGPVERVHLVVDSIEAGREPLERAVALGIAVRRARDLANTPPNEKTPAWLAEQASKLAAEADVQVRIWDEGDLAAAGFGGILGVGSGSMNPPRLIELTYVPAEIAGSAAGRAAGGTAGGDGTEAPHIVLIGKGITFDSGGLSLKPRDAMVTMKTDMSGGGAVIAAMCALRDLGVRVRVTGLVAAAENLPSGSALRPGDVISQYGGRTVEVFNTDAEGRLVLADALAYACAALDPDVLVDLATLTGAASLGLGRRHAALYATDDLLADALISAASAGGERLWRMPLVEDYRSALDSDIADLSHISRDPAISGGSITAALFLREFVAGRPWAHLDIAGPARSDSDEHEVTKGGTGFGTRTLLRWLEQLSQQRS